MRTEFKIPLWYTLKRYMIRHECRLKTSIVAYFSSMLRDYIWIPLYALYMLEGPMFFHIVGIILHLIVFSIAYEIGYIYTDTISIKKENVSIRKVIYKIPVPEKEVYLSIIWRLIIIMISLFFMRPWLDQNIVSLYLSVLLIYWAYGNLSERYRIPLFLLLRFLKGFVPYAFLLFQLNRVNFALTLLLLLATSLFLSIEYASRKLETKYINIQESKYVWIRYLLILGCIAPYVFLDHIPFDEFSLLFTIYISIHILMIILSLGRRFVLSSDRTAVALSKSESNDNVRSE